MFTGTFFHTLFALPRFAMTTVVQVTGFSDGAFVVVAELGPGNFRVERFATESAARKRAGTYWVCWVCFQQRSTGELDEMTSGGIGFSVVFGSIRKYANETLNPHAAGLSFRNSASYAVGDASISPGNRIVFGLVYPFGLNQSSTYIFVDKEKPVDRIVTAAAKHAGLAVEKGKLVGSPERCVIIVCFCALVRMHATLFCPPLRLRACARVCAVPSTRLNLFTLDGENIRLDLEVVAHLGRTLHAGDVLVLEKGNRVEASRLRAVRSVLT